MVTLFSCCDRYSCTALSYLLDLLLYAFDSAPVWLLQKWSCRWMLYFCDVLSEIQFLLECVDV
jgi:hypothetical protein